MPSGSALISPTAAACAPIGWARSAARAASASSARHDRHQLPLVGHVERIDAEQVAGRVHRRVDGQLRLVEHHREVRRLGQLVAHGAEPAAGGVAHPAGARRRDQQVVDQVAERRGVGPDVGVERQVAAGQHHRHAVVGDGARHEHDVAGLHELRRRATGRRGARRRRRS